MEQTEQFTGIFFFTVELDETERNNYKTIEITLFFYFTVSVFFLCVGIKNKNIIRWPFNGVHFILAIMNNNNSYNELKKEVYSFV